LRIESPAFAPHHDAALNPTAREDQGADRHALGAGNVCTDAFAFDSAGVQCIIRDGNRDRYRLGIGVSVSGGAGVCGTRASPQKTDTLNAKPFPVNGLSTSRRS
jgi:hypothetical protein